MTEKMFSQFFLNEMLNSNEGAFAFADTNYKIISFSKAFKNALKKKRIKNTSFITLFNLFSDHDKSFNKKISFDIPDASPNARLEITPIKKGKVLKGYFLELKKQNVILENNINNGTKNYVDVSFPKQLQPVLVMLAKESSIESIAEEILKRCVYSSESSFASIVFYDKDNLPKYLFFDPANEINDKKDIEKILDANLSFINKWMEVNNKSLVVEDSTENIG